MVIIIVINSVIRTNQDLRKKKISMLILIASSQRREQGKLPTSKLFSILKSFKNLKKFCKMKLDHLLVKEK